MIAFLSNPWPWYVAGPVIGLFVPLLLLLDGKLFGVSSSLRHVCAAVLPGSLIIFVMTGSEPASGIFFLWPAFSWAA